MFKIKSNYIIFLFLLPNFLQATQIHVFGDSHASFCFSNERSAIPRDEISWFHYNRSKNIRFSIHWLGSKTMFSIGRDGLKVLDFRKFGVHNNDVAVFVFGEIDARCHVGKQRDVHKRDQGEIIESLASNFVEMVKNNRNNFPNVHCVVVSITPPTNNAYNWVYPYHGPIEDRVAVTCQLNATLKQLCEKNAIGFLDIYSMYANAQGILDDNVSDKVVHVNPANNDQIKHLLIDLLQKKHGIFQ